MTFDMVRKSTPIVATLIAFSTSSGSAVAAGPPPLDRPTPPACCADGLCYPNPTTFGVYATRWRRWPTEALQPTAEAPPTEPDLAPYERPPVEEEDRAAPPPTRAAEEIREEEEDAATPDSATPDDLPFSTPPGGTQPRGPAGDIQTPPRIRLPWEVEPDTNTPTSPAGPTAPPTAPLNNAMPTGDLDPPPPPPFGRPALANDGPVRAMDLPSTRPVGTSERPQLPNTSYQKPASTDPPPAFPIAQANARL